MRRIVAIAATVLIMSALACAGPITYVATLNGANEFPPNASPGTGFATVVFDPVAHTLSVSATFQDLLGLTTAAHIHCCTATPGVGTASVATQTPSFIGFPLGVTAGTFSNTFDLTLAGSWRSGFINDNGGTLSSAEAVLGAGLASGSAYFNIHSDVYSGGEIRGFLQPVPEPATMTLLACGLLGFVWRSRRTSK